MTIVVVDGMGGGIGVQLIAGIRRQGLGKPSIVALGTNAVATQRMIEAGADRGASGEGAIRVSLSLGDIILGPLGIVLPNAMMGEVSPAIAEAIMNARGRKILLPVSQTHLTIVGFEAKSLGVLVEEALAELSSALARGVDSRTEAPLV